MDKGKKIAILFLLLLSLSFSSLVWKKATNGPIITKPVIFDSNIVVGSSDGYLYAYSTAGEEQWNELVGKYIVQPLVMDGNLMVAGTNGKIKYLDDKGEIKWELDLKEEFGVEYIYGIGGESIVYVSANNGVYKVTKGGIASEFYPINATVTPPAVSNGNVVIGAGKELIVLDGNGNERWKKEIEDFWRSAPLISSGRIYVGTLDGNVRGLDFSNGFEQWKVETNGWIMGDFMTDGGTLYFGSNDGYVYAIDKFTGEVKWKTKTEQAVQGTPESGKVGIKDVVFVGSNDKNIYAIEKTTGKIVWKYATEGWVNDPLYYENMVIFGSHDNNLYAFNTGKACTITEPVEDTTMGYKEVKIKGMALSRSGGASASIRVNGGPWESVQTDNSEWIYILDPTNLPEGQNVVECRVSDSSGPEKPPYSGVTIYRSLSEPLGTFKIAAPDSVEVGNEFIIYVSDKDTGNPVENFKIVIDGKEYTKTNNITLKMNTAGVREITISKTGFNDGVITLDVFAPVDPVYIVGPIIGLIVIVVAVYFYFAKIRKPFEKK